MTTIFSIGHSRHTGEHFVSLLRAHEIERLVDVRSHPASKWAPQFGKAALAQMLMGEAIEYVFLGRELGGRPDGAKFYGPDGAVDYERRAQAPDFKAGVERLVGLVRERRTAIMCAEEDERGTDAARGSADREDGRAAQRGRGGRPRTSRSTCLSRCRSSVFTEHLQELQHGVPVARGDRTMQRQLSERRRQRAPALAVRVPGVDFLAR